MGMAARIAIGTVVSQISADARRTDMRRVAFCCFDRVAATHYEDAFAELGLA